MESSDDASPLANGKLLTYAEAKAFLAAKGFAKLKWLPSDCPEGVLLVAGPLRLESLRLDDSHLEVNGVIVDGDLEVALLENGEQDFGPFLVVAGSCKAHNVAIAGAPVEIRGNLTVTGTFHGYYNHGITHVRGDVHAQLLIADDYSFSFDGTASGTFLTESGYVKGKLPETQPDVRQIIDAAFLDIEDEADGEDVRVSFKSQDIYERLVAGGSILRAA